MGRRLIDTDAAYAVLTDYYHHSTDTQHAALREALERVETVDAVPVVRCRDCLHNRACEIQYHAQAGDLFFCGAAERKDGDDGKAD